MEGSFCFLGTGSSLGVPIVGCKCSTCQSKNPKNKRFRCAALLEINDKTFLLDAGPDHRDQSLLKGIDHLDGVIITHAHYDHIGGLDDLKPYSYLKNKLPVLLSRAAIEEIKEKFSYLFSSLKKEESPFFIFEVVEDLPCKKEFQGLSLECLSFFQGKTQVMGIRVGDLSYISDINMYQEDLISSLKGVKTLILSVSKSSGGAHFSLEEALAFSDKIEAKKTYLTHIPHDFEHEELQNLLPQSVFVAYDNLTISFQI